jgi:hypothetical protein
MADFMASLTGGFGGFSIGSLFSSIKIILIAVVVLIVIGSVLWYFWNKKNWNLKVEFKLPRSVKYLKEGGTLSPDDVNGFTDAEWGKGFYNAKTGVVYLKRKGKRKVAMKPFQLSRFLQGQNTLTVIQIGAEEYMPVIPESYLIYEDEKGDCASLLNVKADISESKSWRVQYEREAKKAYSIMGLLDKYGTWIGIGLVIFLWGVQFVMLYNKMKCGG